MHNNSSNQISHAYASSIILSIYSAHISIRLEPRKRTRGACVVLRCVASGCGAPRVRCERGFKLTTSSISCIKDDDRRSRGKSRQAGGGDVDVHSSLALMNERKTRRTQPSSGRIRLSLIHISEPTRPY